jgi:hypothetical protein
MKYKPAIRGYINIRQLLMIPSFPQRGKQPEESQRTLDPTPQAFKTSANFLVLLTT